MAILVTPTQKPWDKTCTKSSHLTQAALTVPQISEIIEYTEPRMLSTLITGGAKSPYDTVGNRTKTKIGNIPEDKKVGDTGLRYRKMGRIQINSIINSQVGTTNADGTFVLSLRDDYITQGMMVQFYSRSFQCRVMSYSGTPGAYLYTFKSSDGTLFDWATHVAPQDGEKTAFGFFSAFGEQSDRGYSRSHFPEEYIEHMTIQRKSTEISGNALSQVIWYNFGGKAKGWWWAKQRQMRLQWMRENEFHKWISRSSMVDSTGAYLTRSNIQDEKGNDVIIGNGIIPQLEGGNEAYGSGADGHATFDDYTDMMRTLTKKSNNEDYGNQYYAITGTEGYGNAQIVLRDYWANSLGGRMVKQMGDSAKTGGPDMSIGANFDTINFEGNSLTFVQHPLFDDELAWAARGSDGGVLQSGMCIFLCMNKVEGRSNVEILSNGNAMVNRKLVEFMKNGMTGYNEFDVMSSTDAMEYHVLMQDMIVIYNTDSCGIIHRSPIV